MQSKTGHSKVYHQDRYIFIFLGNWIQVGKKLDKSYPQGGRDTQLSLETCYCYYGFAGLRLQRSLGRYMRVSGLCLEHYPVWS
jgi:hypothetical protein